MSEPTTMPDHAPDPPGDPGAQSLLLRAERAEREVETLTRRLEALSYVLGGLALVCLSQFLAKTVEAIWLAALPVTSAILLVWGLYHYLTAENG